MNQTTVTASCFCFCMQAVRTENMSCHSFLIMVNTHRRLTFTTQVKLFILPRFWINRFRGSVAGVLHFRCFSYSFDVMWRSINTDSYLQWQHNLKPFMLRFRTPTKSQHYSDLASYNNSYKTPVSLKVPIKGSWVLYLVLLSIYPDLTSPLANWGQLHAHPLTHH